MKAARRWGLTPGVFDGLPRRERREMLALEQEREEMKRMALQDWPANDLVRNVGVVLLALD